MLRSTIALLVVLDPLGIVPIFIALTQKMERAKRTEVSKTIIVTAAGLLFAFAIAGTQIFSVLGITLQFYGWRRRTAIYCSHRATYWRRVAVHRDRYRRRNGCCSSCFSPPRRTRCNNRCDNFVGDNRFDGNRSLDSDSYWNDLYCSKVCRPNLQGTRQKGFIDSHQSFCGIRSGHSRSIHCRRSKKTLLGRCSRVCYLDCFPAVPLQQ